MKVALYSRVSTDEQETENQLVELRDFCKRMDYEIYDEYIDPSQSGTKFDRPDLQRMLKDAFTKKFDIIIVWKLDRLGRSLKDLIIILDKLKEKDIGFVSLTQQIDTSTPTGKAMFHLLGLFAELERDLISERTKLALRRVKEKGTKLGRPVIPDNVILEIIRLRDKEKLSMKKISKVTGVSVGKVHNILKRFSKTL